MMAKHFFRQKSQQTWVILQQSVKSKTHINFSGVRISPLYLRYLIECYTYQHQVFSVHIAANPLFWYNTQKIWVHIRGFCFLEHVKALDQSSYYFVGVFSAQTFYGQGLYKFFITALLNDLSPDLQHACYDNPGALLEKGPSILSNHSDFMKCRKRE